MVEERAVLEERLHEAQASYEGRIMKMQKQMRSLQSQAEAQALEVEEMRKREKAGGGPDALDTDLRREIIWLQEELEAETLKGRRKDKKARVCRSVHREWEGNAFASPLYEIRKEVLSMKYSIPW